MPHFDSAHQFQPEGNHTVLLQKGWFYKQQYTHNNSTTKRLLTGKPEGYV